MRQGSLAPQRGLTPGAPHTCHVEGGGVGAAGGLGGGVGYGIPAVAVTWTGRVHLQDGTVRQEEWEAGPPQPRLPSLPCPGPGVWGIYL